MVYGSDSHNVDSVRKVGKYGSFPTSAGEDWWENHRAESLNEQVTILASLMRLLEEGAKLESESVAPSESAPGNRVFLVHGRDESAVASTARFLETLGLDVTILREEPNAGRTIIEEFIDYTDVGFAVVLLTPDDRGGSSTAPYESQSPRARQNVILELGFFLGKLGRANVCALYWEGVEIPSDYAGVAFVPFDDQGGWKLLLSREMKERGLPIDMNRAV